MRFPQHPDSGRLVDPQSPIPGPDSTVRAITCEKSVINRMKKQTNVQDIVGVEKRWC
jgi:hypothetical protein